MYGDGISSDDEPDSKDDEWKPNDKENLPPVRTYLIVVRVRLCACSVSILLFFLVLIQDAFLSPKVTKQKKKKTKSSKRRVAVCKKGKVKKLKMSPRDEVFLCVAFLPCFRCHVGREDTDCDNGGYIM
jgi:hypothetical protein